MVRQGHGFARSGLRSATVSTVAIAAAGALAGSDPPAAQLVTDAEELSHALHRLLSDAPALEASRRAASRVAAELEGGVLEAVWQELAGPLGLPAAETADE